MGLSVQSEQSLTSIMEGQDRTKFFSGDTKNVRVLVLYKQDDW